MTQYYSFLSLLHDFRDYVAMENMMNPPETSIGLNGSTCGMHEVTRYQIDLNMQKVQTMNFPSTSAHLEDGEELGRYYNKFDFPAINEAYRGREVNDIIIGVPATSRILKGDSQKLSFSILRKVPFLIF